LIYFLWFPIFIAKLEYLKHKEILQTSKLNSKKQKKFPFYEEKSLVGLTPGQGEPQKSRRRKKV
jgi:hypothetical protein